MIRAMAPGGGHGVNSIINGRIGLCRTSARVTSRLHIGDAMYRGVRQLKHCNPIRTTGTERHLIAFIPNEYFSSTDTFIDFAIQRIATTQRAKI